jgi:hypothetical protein
MSFFKLPMMNNVVLATSCPYHVNLTRVSAWHFFIFYETPKIKGYFWVYYGILEY